MAYGWGYRGSVGHEQGAMLPGALLGLAVCLAAGRTDWHRRSALVGLCAAVGWAWGGSISYMEHTFYVKSDSFPDVLYGYTMLFFIGGLWAGCGGAILGMGLTKSRSELECLVRPLIALGTTLMLVYVYLQVFPEHNEAYDTFTIVHFHDGDWLSATITLIVSSIYWVLRPKDRKGAALFFWCAVAWWIGYGLLTKLGGLRLAPLHRSESWGGVLGVLITLIIYLRRQKNQAALMLCYYGCLGGGLAFAAAVFLRHPLEVRWGPLASVQLPLGTWTFAEMSYGGLMGLAIALGTLRLIRGGLTTAEEDCDRSFTDAFSAFVIVVALAWMNFRRHFVRILATVEHSDSNTLFGFSTGVWYSAIAVILTLPAVYILYRYYRGDRGLFPQSAFGKGAAIALIALGSTASAHLLDGHHNRITLLANLWKWLPGSLSVLFLLSFTASAEKDSVPATAQTPYTDDRWKIGKLFFAICLVTPLIMLGFASLTTAMQNDSHGNIGRRRFGEQAYWRQTARLLGDWQVLGVSDDLGNEILASENSPIRQLNFDTYRNVAVTLDSGEVVEEHRWFLKNQYIWMHWYNKNNSHPDQAEVPLQFHEGKIYVLSPGGKKSGKYLVLERSSTE